MSDLADQLLGQVVGGYRLTKKLGEGGMAVVMRGESLIAPKICRAIKIVRPQVVSEKRFIQRFIEEATLLERFANQHIVKFYGIKREHELLFMELELLDGSTLGERKFAGGHNVREVLSWLLQAAEGLQAAHTQKVLHRDLKPSNLFLCNSGTLKIIDFGIATLMKEQTASDTLEGHVLGSPAFMAPEVCQGRKPSSASDIYALGLIGYQLLLGEHPLLPSGHHLTTRQVLLAHVHGSLPSLEYLDLPDGLEVLLRRATSRDPKKRYQTGSELVDALREIDHVMRLGVHPAFADQSQGGSDISGPPNSDYLTWLTPLMAGVLIASIFWLSLGLMTSSSQRAPQDPHSTLGSVPQEQQSKSDLEIEAVSSAVENDDESRWLDKLKLDWIALSDEGGLSRSILKNEVMIGQYLSCVAAGVCLDEPRKPTRVYGECVSLDQSKEEEVINCVTYEEALLFAGWVNTLYQGVAQREGRRQGDQIRIPTRQDWRVAYEGATYPWGMGPPDCDHAVYFAEAPACGAHLGPQRSCSRPLGKTRQGACDVAGNLWEWLQAAEGDPEGQAPIAGGGWSSSAVDLQGNTIKYRKRSERSTAVGIRLIRIHLPNH